MSDERTTGNLRRDTGDALARVFSNDRTTASLAFDVYGPLRRALDRAERDDEEGGG